MPSIYEKTKKQCLNKGKKGEISKKNSEIIASFTDNLMSTGHRKGQYSERRLQKYIYGLTSIARLVDYDFDKATRKDIDKTVASIRASQWSNETVRDYLVLLKGVIRYCIDPEGKTYDRNDAEFPDIVKHIKPGNRGKSNIKRSELITIKDIQKLIDRCSNTRDKAFIHLLYESGCRIGELIGDTKLNQPGLCIKDVAFTKHGADIDVIGKTGHRTIFIYTSVPSLAEWLNNHPKRNNPNAPVFCGIWSNIGGQINYRYWNKLLKKLAKDADIHKPVNPHHFRHSRLTHLARELPESILKQFAGWEQDSKQASTYVHLSGRDTKSSLLKMYGIKEDDEKDETLTVITCARCGVKNDPFARFCKGCQLALSDKAQIEYAKQELTQAQKMEKLTERLNLMDERRIIQKKMDQGEIAPNTDEYDKMDERLNAIDKKLEELSQGKSNNE